MGGSDLDPVEEARLLGVSLEAYLQVFQRIKFKGRLIIG